MLSHYDEDSDNINHSVNNNINHNINDKISDNISDNISEKSDEHNYIININSVIVYYFRQLLQYSKNAIFKLFIKLINLFKS
jgi:hypothetical protein